VASTPWNDIIAYAILTFGVFIVAFRCISLDRLDP